MSGTLTEISVALVVCCTTTGREISVARSQVCVLSCPTVSPPLGALVQPWLLSAHA